MGTSRGVPERREAAARRIKFGAVDTGANFYTEFGYVMITFSY
jgi:hypothetical protein